MTGPLEREFAQVLEPLEYPAKATARTLDDPDWPRYLTREERLALAALASIERHVQDMEKALHEIAYAKERQPVKKTTGVRGELRFIHSWPSRSVALAALPAREKEEETNG